MGAPRCCSIIYLVDCRLHVLRLALFDDIHSGNGINDVFPYGGGAGWKLISARCWAIWHLNGKSLRKMIRKVVILFFQKLSAIHMSDPRNTSMGVPRNRGV